MEKEKTEKSGADSSLVMKKLQENRLSLRISRVPDDTKKAFIALAEKSFCGDYGMTLKWLVDDIIDQDTRAIMAKLDEIEQRLHLLENPELIETETNPEVVTRKMCDGSLKTVRGPGKNE